MSRRLFIAAGSKDNPPHSLTARVPSALTMVFGDELLAILGLDRVAHRLERRVASIHLVREVHFVGAAPVVVGAASADRESEGHRLQRPGLVAGDLEALHLRRECDAPPADGGRGAATTLSQQVPQPFPRADQLDRLQHGIAAAKSEPRFVEESALDTLHREGDGAPGADGVDAELVAPPRRAEDGVAVRDAAERAEGEQTLVLDANAAVAQRVDVFASD